MLDTAAYKRLATKLERQTDGQLKNLYHVSDVMQALQDIKSDRYKEYSVVMVAIEEELTRRHGSDTAAAMIDLCQFNTI